VKNSNGATWIGAAGADVRVSAANGAITVERAEADVEARSAYGAIRVADAARGRIELNTAMGELEVGIRDGVPAWLELHSHFGTVRNSLQAAGVPESTDEAVEVHASTSYGDIIIRRA
jgi:DUF4097 and DUF4098 domain-containing protein YvlB